MKKNTHSPERQNGSSTSDDEPNPAVADEVLESADEKSGPERQELAETAGEEADAVTEVLGDTEPGDLPLVVVERALDHRRNAAEQVADTRHRLQPHCRHENQPSVAHQPLHPLPQPTHQNFLKLNCL